MNVKLQVSVIPFIEQRDVGCRGNLCKAGTSHMAAMVSHIYSNLVTLYQLIHFLSAETGFGYAEIISFSSLENVSYVDLFLSYCDISSMPITEQA
jgi:hypothetical protein